MLEKILKYDRITFLYRTTFDRQKCHSLASIISKNFINVIELDNNYYDKHTINKIYQLSNDDNIIFIKNNFRIFSVKTNRYESIINLRYLKKFINITDIGTSSLTLNISDLVISIKDSIFTIEKIRYHSIPNNNHFNLLDIKNEERILKISKIRYHG